MNKGSVWAARALSSNFMPRPLNVPGSGRCRRTFLVRARSCYPHAGRTDAGPRATPAAERRGETTHGTIRHHRARLRRASAESLPFSDGAFEAALLDHVTR